MRVLSVAILGDHVERDLHVEARRQGEQVVDLIGDSLPFPYARLRPHDLPALW
jgi:hypothetical protein